MCRSADYEQHEHGLHPRHRPRRLNFNCFLLRLPCSAGGAAALPESLSLVFLPRISGSPLHVNSSKIRGDTPAFLTLHRVLTTSDLDVVFAARDHVRASDGLSFEVHVGQHRFLKGVFRAHQGEDEDEVEDQHDCYRHSNSSAWKIECKCVLLDTSEIGGLLHLREPEAELSVAVDGAGDVNLLRHRINIVNLHSSSSRRRGRRRCRTFKMCLEDIPEAEEDELSIHHQSASGTTADDDDGGCSSDDEGVPAVDDDIEIEMDGVGWAVDVGFWVMCLGMGFLLSRASANTFTRKTFLL